MALFSGYYKFTNSEKFGNEMDPQQGWNELYGRWFIFLIIVREPLVFPSWLLKPTNRSHSSTLRVLMRLRPHACQTHRRLAPFTGQGWESAPSPYANFMRRHAHEFNVSWWLAWLICFHFLLNSIRTVDNRTTSNYCKQTWMSYFVHDFAELR